MQGYPESGRDNNQTDVWMQSRKSITTYGSNKPPSKNCDIETSVFSGHPWPLPGN